MDKDRGLTTTQLAEHFGVSIHRVRRWIKAECPCLAEGSCGPGHAARFDPVAVKQWLDQRDYPGLAAKEQRDVLKIMETTLLHALRTDELRGKELPTELMALLIYERGYLDLTGEHLQEQDLPPDLLRYHNMHLSSVNRRTF